MVKNPNDRKKHKHKGKVVGAAGGHKRQSKVEGLFDKWVWVEKVQFELKNFIDFSEKINFFRKKKQKFFRKR